MTVAALDTVSKRFGTIVALDHVSLQLMAGSTVALLGPNGAGKSTLASLLLGLRRPDRGTVRVCGRDPHDRHARIVLAGMPQEVAFPLTLRVAEIVDFVQRHFPDPRPVPDVLDEFGLQELSRRQVGALSVGQRRRLALAAAFVARPALLVLDEPTAGLDAPGRRTAWDAVEAARARGAAVLVATHHLDEAEAIATHVVALDRGRVTAEGEVREVVRRAGRTRIRFRTNGATPPDGVTAVDGWAQLDVDDAGDAVARLIHAGVRLDGLEVRALTLAEALVTLDVDA